MMDTKSKSVGCSGRNLRYRIFFILFCILLVSPAAAPDTLILKSGKTVQGTIRERNAKSIQLDVGLDFPITYYLDEVQKITPDDQTNASNNNTKQSAAASRTNSDEADHLEQQGLDLIEAGNMDEGLALLHKAIALDPKANRHLNFGAILSGNGVSVFKQGHKEDAIRILKESENEIKKAISMFDPNQESIFLSQAYYLLGEMYAQAFQDIDGARKYFKKSISLYSNPAAERGLKALPQE